LPETPQLVEATLATLEVQDLAGKSVLVVAGGTREYIDPVRYLGNRSSGKQGIALVAEAKARGAKVTLIAANFDFSASDVVTLGVETTAELISTIDGLSTLFDFVIMPAAVSDFRSEVLSATKLKKKNDSSGMSLELIQNPDLIAEISKVGKKRNDSMKVVGFAAETATGIELTQLAKSKLDKKGLDLIVANDVSNGAAFDSDTNSVLILGTSISEEVSGTKREIAGAIFDQLLKLP
jgi:phosphopantothenoylcysteine decarboxylase/phosphopantothenate--cysteine ligase